MKDRDGTWRTARRGYDKNKGIGCRIGPVDLEYGEPVDYRARSQVTEMQIGRTRARTASRSRPVSYITSFAEKGTPGREKKKNVEGDSDVAKKN